MISLPDLNQLDPDEAAALVRPCLDVDRWVDAVVDGRPYGSVEVLFGTARTAASPFTARELEAALGSHPRIGERPAGSSVEAGLSRSEQAGLALGADVQRRLEEGNRAYEARFGRVFLVRAAGRSSTEVLAQLEDRLGNDVDTEDTVVEEQLRQIALIRLAGIVQP